MNSDTAVSDIATVPANIRVGVVGAAGLSAGVLLGLLARHPQVVFGPLVSESSPGATVASAHPKLGGVLDAAFSAFDADALADCDFVFSAKRHGESFAYIRALLGGRARVIDLSGDYRLTDPAQFRRWYGVDHGHPDLLSEAVYGLPEQHRAAIRGARLVANPGCYTTASIVGCAPLVAAGFGRPEHGAVVVHAISGVSGAGRGSSPATQYLAVDGNVRPYRLGDHQHTPEIEGQLAYAAAPDAGYRAAGHAVAGDGKAAGPRVLFAPHVGPYQVGILASCYFPVPSGPAGQLEPTTDSLTALLTEAYSAEPFVRVSPAGGPLPQIAPVAGTNFVDVGAAYDARTRTAVVVSALDNLVKGAAGQAIQNMNIMAGLPEATGLR